MSERIMTEDFVIGPKLGDLVDKIVASYGGEPRTQHIDRVYLPSLFRAVLRMVARCRAVSSLTATY